MVATGNSKHLTTRLVLAVCGVLVAAMAAACGGPEATTAPTATTAPVVPASDASAKEAWQVEWDKVVAAAKEEGRLNITHRDTDLPAIEAFQQKYGIKVTAIPGSMDELTQRINLERQAGLFTIDGYRTSDVSGKILYDTGALAPIADKLIIPEVTDQTLWWQGKHTYQDEEGQFIFVYNTTKLSLLCANPQVASELTSYKDLLDPKYKGRIVAYDPARGGFAGTGLRYFYYHEDFGPSFIEKLFSTQEITLLRDRNQTVDWLARGQKDIWLFAYETMCLDAKDQGLAVEDVSSGGWKEGAILFPNAFVILQKPPHPNAQKVWLNFFFSKEGQSLLQGADKRGLVESLRTDIPKDKVRASAVRRTGENYKPMWNSKWIELEPALAVFKNAYQAPK